MSRILVVDGAPSVRESVRMILGGEHDVAVAATPDDAAAAAGRARPDLVLAGGPAGAGRRSSADAAPWAEPLRCALPAPVVPVLSLPLPFSVTDLRGAVRRVLGAAVAERARMAGSRGGASGAREDGGSRWGAPGVREDAGSRWGAPGVSEGTVSRSGAPGVGEDAVSRGHAGAARPSEERWSRGGASGVRDDGAPEAAPAPARGWRETLVEALLDAGDTTGSLRRLASRAAATALPVLLVGERGTGREMLARWIHVSGPRAREPFIALACGGLTPAALAARLMRVPLGAARPTLFLKALDDASPDLQRALLALLESGTLPGEPGEEGRAAIDVRPIASASDALWERIERGLVAEPLVETLGVLTLALPALRDRPALLTAAAGPLLERVAGDAGWSRPPRLSPAAGERLALYCWPGNLRELACVLARSAALAEGDHLEAEDMDFGVATAGAAARFSESVSRSGAPGVREDAASREHAGQVRPSENVSRSGAPGVREDAASREHAGQVRPSESGSRRGPSGAWEDAGSQGGASGAPEAVAPGSVSAPGAPDRPAPPADLPASPGAVTPEELLRLSAIQDDSAPPAAATPAAFIVLAGELAHELKNPLVAIKTFTQLLGDKFDDAEFRREFYGVVRREVERIDHLVEGIVHAADRRPTEVRPTDLNGLLEAVLAESEPWMVERRVVAFKELAGGLPAAWTDPGQARAAVFNVIARALASLPPGGDLFLATRAAPSLQLIVSYGDPSPSAAGVLGPGGEELELALARVALGRAGGRFLVERDPGRRTTVTLEFHAVPGVRSA